MSMGCMLAQGIDDCRWVVYDRISDAEAAFRSPAAWRVLRAAGRRRRVGGGSGQPHEGPCGSDTADDARGSLEGEITDLHLRLHRGPGPEPVDDLAPHGQAEGGWPGGQREGHHLDVLPAPPRSGADHAQASWPADRLASSGMPAGRGMTVRGPIPARDLGITLMHEDMFIDLSFLWAPPSSEWQKPLVPTELTP